MEDLKSSFNRNQVVYSDYSQKDQFEAVDKSYGDDVTSTLVFNFFLLFHRKCSHCIFSSFFCLNFIKVVCVL